ncbi:MAG: PEGA domain-containing protein [Deltaproteobacteria bacterium]|nr:PEGA domain-containing protein [Deltaproteobacteria bacterium]
MRRGILTIAMATIVGVGVPAGTSFAQEPDARVKEAKRLRDRGTEAFEAKEYAAALQYFEDAHRAFPTPILKYNIALALGKLGRLAEAIESYEAFLHEAKDADADARAFAAAEIPKLEKQVSTLVITAATAGAEVAIDGKTRGKTPLARPLRLDPGRHRVSLSRAGHQQFAADLTLQAGETRRIFPELRPVEVVAQPAPPPPPPTFARRHRWSLATGGVAVALAGVGTGLGASTWSTYKDLSRTCAGTATGCTPGQIDGAKHRALATNVMFGAAGAAAVTAAILFYVEHRRTSKTEVVVVPTLGGGTLLVRY